jgi:hypothetical protein
MVLFVDAVDAFTLGELSGYCAAGGACEMENEGEDANDEGLELYEGER